MRLLDIEKTALTNALESVQGEVFLYGSRTDDTKRGGDIDLLVRSRTPSPYRLAQDITVQFQMVCDEKIDVLVVDPDHMTEEQHTFLSTITPTPLHLT